jgi:hypothetical protein
MNLDAEKQDTARNLEDGDRERRKQEAERIRQEFVKSKKLPWPPYLKPPEGDQFHGL